MTDDVVALEAHEVTRRFGEFVANQSVNLSVRMGERRALIGPNGAGKTTLFNMLAGQLPPSSGRITLFGQDVTHVRPERRARLGLARTFQLNVLFDGLTTLENLEITLAAGDASRFVFYRKLGAVASIRRRGMEILKKWGLESVADKRVGSLSYGRQRQLEIILALCRQPRVLLLDEPTAGLAAADAAELVQVIASLPRDVTVVMIEHDIDVAFSIADKVTVLYDGSVLCEGTPGEIAADERVTTAYLGGLANAPD